MFEESNQYLTFLFLLFFLFVLFLIQKYTTPTPKEAFIQEHPFIIKRNENTYDEFSSKIYDQIFYPEKESQYVVENIFQMTKPSPAFTTILDVGCGTGELLNALQKKGFNNVYGLEKSTAMSAECLSKYPSLKVKLGDAMEPMIFEKSTFTHIFCIGMTIYELKDKIAFFRNCYHWLKPNGVLLLHLVNRNNFFAIPAFDPVFSASFDGKERITTTEIDFNDFKYKSCYDFSKKDVVVFTETFVDSVSVKVRKNERMLHMSNEMETTLYDAQYCGFIVTGQINYSKFNGDENQFIFILERPH